MNIFVTGGAGYIGSHTIVELLNLGHNIVVADNLSNSSRESLRRVEEITGKNVKFHEIDLRNGDMLDSIFDTNQFDAVIHFAGLKSVGESVSRALYYYQNNLESTLCLLETMRKFNVKKLVFSSSAAIYGDPQSLPITESATRKANTPYGQTKLMIEQILEDISATNEGWNITSLRYFNPIGAHESGKIGESPNSVPNNILPTIAKVASGEIERLKVFGGDYDTPDGTGIRDYIHVVDLANAHIAALNNLDHPNIYKAYNVGTGTGTSVLELANAFRLASGQDVPYDIVDRREGDIVVSYADPTIANQELGWSARLSVQDACNSAWKWQSQNPNGFEIAGKI